MSYILDALRKSDEQRRRGTTPTLLTPQAAALPAPRRKSLSYWMLGGALLVAGVLIGSLRPWQGAPAPEPAPLAAPASAPAPGTSVAAMAPAEKAKEPVAPAQKTPVAPRAAVPPASVAKSPEKADAEDQVETRARPRRAPRETAAPAAKSAAKSPASRAADSRSASTPAEQPIVKFSELPVEVQLEIPKLQITVHAYSPVARERLVGINDVVLREGASVSPDLKLEQITPDGMVMTYKGHRFRRGVR